MIRQIGKVLRGKATPFQLGALNALFERAVSVPILLLGPEATVRIADREAEVNRLLGAAARAGVDTIERTEGRERISRA